jgi:hypothetical protein
MTPRDSPRPAVEDDAEALLRDMARDTVEAARIGWRIAGRVGRVGLRWFERTSMEVLDEMDKRSQRKGPP